jgi:cell division protein FtsW (lipid II flippase)
LALPILLGLRTDSFRLTCPTALLLFASGIIMMINRQGHFLHITCIIISVLIIGALAIFLSLKLGSPGRITTWQNRIESFNGQGETITRKFRQK